ncbi:MAG: YdeI/OmpD-associated family protein [Anaerolineae bacterium]
MQLDNSFYAVNLASWRAWLEQNYETSNGVWLIFSKAHTGQACVSYSDSLDEALCFGWIDGLIQRIDDDTYARRYTPRTNLTNWSPANKARVLKLLKEGRMRQEGLAKLPDEASLNDLTPRARPRIEVLPELIDALQANPAAKTGWESLAPSQQRNYIGWIMSGKRSETRAKRISEALELLAAGKPLGMK